MAGARPCRANDEGASEVKTTRTILASLMVVACLGTAACTKNTGRGAAIGGAAGAGLGALSGGGILSGAAKGAAVGAAGGFIYDKVRD
jgi:hypothetical protein